MQALSAALKSFDARLLGTRPATLEKWDGWEGQRRDHMNMKRAGHHQHVVRMETFIDLTHSMHIA
jgi:hypothetical protein